MIFLRHVSHSYSRANGYKKLALKEINLSIPPGSFTAIIGPNNSGKSTLAMILSGLLPPSFGRFLFEGVEISQWSPNSLRKSIGLIFSNPEDQIVFPTVEEDLAFGLENFCFDPGQIEKRVLDILEFIGMKEYRHFFIHQLSGGQKQKLAIASILILGLRYVIFDEPTSFLDDTSREEILTLIRKIHKRGATVIYMAQFFEEIIMADTIVALVNGKIQWQGSFTELLQKFDQMANWGIEVPPVVQLVNRLQKSGLTLPYSIHTVKQLVDALRRIKYEH